VGRRAFTAEQIINKLREAEVMLSRRETGGEAGRRIEVTELRSCGGAASIHTT
jgi:hypothetical protein